jgi:hypothetical protein
MPWISAFCKEDFCEQRELCILSRTLSGDWDGTIGAGKGHMMSKSVMKVSSVSETVG